MKNWKRGGLFFIPSNPQKRSLDALIKCAMYHVVFSVALADYTAILNKIFKRNETQRYVYGKLGIKMCYPIEPRRGKLIAQIYKLEPHPQFAIYIVRVRLF